MSKAWITCHHQMLCYNKFNLESQKYFKVLFTYDAQYRVLVFIYGHLELLGWNKLEKNYWYPHPRPVLSCGHINIHSFLDKDTTGKDFRDDKQPSRSMWSEFAFIDKSCSRRALLRRRSWLAASASCSWKIRVKFSSSFKRCF